MSFFGNELVWVLLSLVQCKYLLKVCWKIHEKLKKRGKYGESRKKNQNGIVAFNFSTIEYFMNPSYQTYHYQN